MKDMQVNMEKREMGRGVWHELRFRYKELEVIVTVGITSGIKDDVKLNAFLGVAISSHISQETNCLRFALCYSPEIFSCVRMLQSYKW